MVGHKVVYGLLHPRNAAKVVVAIPVPALAQRSREVAFVVVIQCGNCSIEIVVKPFFAHKRTLCLRSTGIKAILRQLLVLLILLVIAAALGVMQGKVKVPVVAHQLVPQQLVMLLVVVVVLILIELGVPCGIILHLSTWIVSTSVLLLVVLRGKIPCVISLFHSVKGDEFHHSGLAEIASLQEIRV